MTRQFWTRAALCCGLCAALLCGCGAAPSRSTVDPQDPLTGEQPAAPGQRVAAVAVSNDPEAGPQRGLSTASVVLEALSSEIAVIFNESRKRYGVRRVHHELLDRKSVV